MPRVVDPIPLGAPITEKDNTASLLFRYRWQQVIDGATITPTLAATQLLTQNAAIATTAVYTTLNAGRYRISYYIRKTQVDGVSSSLTVTLGWTESGVPLTETFAAIAADSVTTGKQEGSIVIYADSATDLTFAVAYASNTPGQMKYRIDVVAEQLA